MTECPPLRRPLRARIAACAVVPQHRAAPGLITPRREAARAAGREEEARCSARCSAGLTVLDIVRLNGFFSLAAKRRGAARVLATDSHCWDHPHYRGRETLELCAAELEPGNRDAPPRPHGPAGRAGALRPRAVPRRVLPPADPLPVMEALGR
jgi:hypothetical protein